MWFNVVKVLYHILVLVFFQHRNSQCRDDTPLKVQDSCCFTILRVQFHIIQTLNHDPQGIPLKNSAQSPNIPLFFFQWFKLSWRNYILFHFSSKGIRAGAVGKHRVTLCVRVNDFTQPAASSAHNETTSLRHFNFNLWEEGNFFFWNTWIGKGKTDDLASSWGVSHTLQEALCPFLRCEAPLIAFRDSASYWYSYLCRLLYLWATRRDEIRVMRNHLLVIFWKLLLLCKLDVNIKMNLQRQVGWSWSCATGKQRLIICFSTCNTTKTQCTTT